MAFKMKGFGGFGNSPVKYEKDPKEFSERKAKEKRLTEEKDQEKRFRKVRMSQKLGRTIPTTRENLQQHLDYIRGSQDLFL
jgi:hypothetical protein